MFQNDYIMRQIEMMVQFIARTILKKDAVVYEVIPDETGNISSEGELYLNLMSKIKQGKINEAENLLFEEVVKNPNNSMLEIALDFYRTLSELPDEFLEENNFSKDEVQQGLKDIMQIYHIDILSDFQQC